MNTILVTGANRGIGHQTSLELTRRGNRVYFGTRDREVENGQSVTNCENGRWIQIDIGDSNSIKNATNWLERNEPALDVLINNAGIYPDEGETIADIGRVQLETTFRTNTFGTLEATQGLLSLLRKSEAARIINVSSGYGQLAGLSPDAAGYCLSKLALNGITLMLAENLREAGISVNSVSPGWVRTNMGGSGADRSVEEGAAGIVWLAAEAPQELTGKFFRDGEEIDW